MIKLLYTGIKVSIPNAEQHIHTSLLDSYQRNKYLFTKKIDDDNNCIYVSYAPEGSIVEKINIEFVEPIYDKDLYDVLQEKVCKCYELKKDIENIREAIERQNNII